MQSCVKPVNRKAVVYFSSRKLTIAFIEVDYTCFVKTFSDL